MIRPPKNLLKTQFKKCTYIYLNLFYKKNTGKPRFQCQELITGLPNLYFPDLPICTVENNA
jgi:hypothetical protein